MTALIAVLMWLGLYVLAGWFIYSGASYDLCHEEMMTDYYLLYFNLILWSMVWFEAWYWALGVL